MRAAFTIDDAPSGLSGAIRWLDSFAAANSLDARTRIDLNVVLDEVVSNIVKYAYPADAVKKIRLKLNIDNAMVELMIEDEGRPFDPLSAPTPDVDARLASRKEGGLGIHLVRRLMDEVVYARIAASNRLIVRKRLFAEEDR